MDSRAPSVDLALNDLVGRAMTSVTFVMDYLQVAFDGARLTILTNPQLLRDTEELDWASSDFADAFRQQLGRVLRRVDVSDLCARLTFENGVALSIPLEDDPPRVEHLILEKDGKKIWVA